MISKEKKAGIYKITSPTGRIYIGQTVNIFNRKREYKYLKCKTQSLLYKSILKYGFENHIFDILEYCDTGELHEREVYYISLYRSNNIKDRKGKGLNLTDGGQGSRGFKHAPASLLKMSIKQRSLKRSKESNLKRSNTLKGRPASQKLINKLSGVPQTEAHKAKRLTGYNMRKVINPSSGVIYKSIAEAGIANGIKYATLVGWLNGRYLNRSNLKYV